MSLRRSAVLLYQLKSKDYTAVDLANFPSYKLIYPKQGFHKVLNIWSLNLQHWH
jgi:hypothetical protein